MKLTGPNGSPIIRRSFELFEVREWKGDYVFYISTTVQFEKEARTRI